uniref:Lipid-binding serum glycoprotein N-terminal domain-containing protein n=1 Tax=Strongyloides venezuelensis TaxID=75913 RepID=A0A0K0FVM9_STRVS
MAGIAIDYINSAIAKVNIPDIEGFLKFTCHLSRSKLKNLIFLNLQISFNSHHLINLVSIYREYQEKCKSKTVDVTIQRTSIDVLVGILSLNVIQNFSNSSCTANFGVFDIKKEIEKHFKGKIKEVICQKIENVKSDKGNKILWSFPLDFGLTGTFKGSHIDYTLTSNPESSTISFTISIEGLIYYEGHQNDPKIPKPNNVIHPYNTNKCLCIDFDSDRVLDSAAYAFELSKLNHFMIDDKILKLFPQSIGNFF